MYRFIEDYVCRGTVVKAGIILKGVFEVKEDCVSVVGSSVFQDIPLEKLEAYVLPKKVRKKRAKKAKVKKAKKVKTKAVTQSDASARVSSKTELLRKE